MKRWVILEESKFVDLQKKGLIAHVWNKILNILWKTSASTLLRENPCAATSSPLNSNTI